MKLPIIVNFGNLLLIHELKEELSRNNVFVQQTNVGATTNNNTYWYEIDINRNRLMIYGYVLI